MLYADGVIGLVLLGLWLFAIFDVIATDSALCRNLPKGLWLILVIILPDVGSIAWLILGRPAQAGFRPGDPNYRPARRSVGPEDSSRYLTRSEELDRRLDEWEARQRRLGPADALSGDGPNSDALTAATRDFEAREADLARREKELRRRREGQG